MLAAVSAVRKRPLCEAGANKSDANGSTAVFSVPAAMSFSAVIRCFLRRKITPWQRETMKLPSRVGRGTVRPTACPARDVPPRWIFEQSGQKDPLAIDLMLDRGLA